MSLTQRITRPLTRPLARPITAGGVGGVPAATHYVSQSATNGYAVGVNSGTGTTKAAPWLTLEYAITNAPAGSVIYVNDGTYTPSTFFNCTKTLTIVSPRRRQVTLRAAAGQIRVFNFQSTTTNESLTLIGFVLDGQNNSTSCMTIGNAAHTSTLTFTARDCLFKDPVARGVFSNGQKGLNLNILGCEGSVSGAGFLSGADILNPESGSLRVSGFTLNATSSNTNRKSFVLIRAAGAGVTATVSGVRGTFTDTSLSAGGVDGVVIENVAGAVIESNDPVMASSQASAVGALYWIRCRSGTLNANGGIIRNNAGTNNMQGGYCALIGEDGSTAGDNRHNNGQIYGNNMTANPAANTPIHGVMFGYGTGGEAYDNVLNGAGLALIAKQQIGGEFYNNTVTNAASEAIRTKGATGTTFRDNTVTIGATYPGDGININANDAPVTDSTGIVVSGNVLNIDAAPADVVDVAVGSDATFTGNTYNVNAVLGADPWQYQGTAYQTLAAWKAAIEPTALP